MLYAVNLISILIQIDQQILRPIKQQEFNLREDLSHVVCIKEFYVFEDVEEVEERALLDLLLKYFIKLFLKIVNNVVGSGLVNRHLSLEFSLILIFLDLPMLFLNLLILLRFLFSKKSIKNILFGTSVLAQFDASFTNNGPEFLLILKRLRLTHARPLRRLRKNRLSWRCQTLQRPIFVSL